MIKKLTIEELKRKYNNDLDYSLEHAVERIKKRLKEGNIEIDKHSFNNHDLNDYFRIYYPESISGNKRTVRTQKSIYDKSILSVLYSEEQRRIELHYSLSPNTELLKINLIYNEIIRLDKFINGEKITIKGNDIFYNGNKIIQEKNLYIDYGNYIELVIFSIDGLIKIKIDRNKFDKLRKYKWRKNINNDKCKYAIVNATMDYYKMKKINLYNLLYDNSSIIKFCSFDIDVDYIDYTLENIKKRFEDEIINTDKHIYHQVNRDIYILTIKNKKLEIRKYSKDKNELLSIRNNILTKIANDELI